MNLNGRGSRGHFISPQCTGNRIYNRRIDQRFVALDIDNRVTIQPRCNFCDAIRTAGMISPRHLHPTESRGDVADAFVIGRHNEIGEAMRLFATLDDPLDEGLASDRCERLPREAGGSVAGRNDADSFHRARFSSFVQDCTVEMSGALGFSLPGCVSKLERIQFERSLPPHPSPLPRGEGADLDDPVCGHHLVNTTNVGGPSQSGVALCLPPHSIKVN